MITLMVLNCLAADPSQCRIDANAEYFYLNEEFCEAAVPSYVDWLEANMPHMVLTAYICHEWGNPA